MPQQDGDVFAAQQRQQENQQTQQSQQHQQQHPYYSDGQQPLAPSLRDSAAHSHDAYDIAFPERFPEQEYAHPQNAPQASDGHPVSPFDVAPFLGEDFFAQLPTSPPSGSGQPTSSAAASAPQSATVGAYGSNPAVNEDMFTAAIEEDKRRRNTAASARFRLKKKEREADLERRTRDMTDRCSELEKRINVLETENRWLRELITERSRVRGSTRSVDEKDGKERPGRRKRSGS